MTKIFLKIYKKKKQRINSRDSGDSHEGISERRSRAEGSNPSPDTNLNKVIKELNDNPLKFGKYLREAYQKGKEDGYQQALKEVETLIDKNDDMFSINDLHNFKQQLRGRLK